MPAARSSRLGRGLVLACLLGAILPGCWIFSTPDSARYDLARRLRTPEETTEWTLGLSTADHVDLGVGALMTFIEDPPPVRGEFRIEVIDGLGRIAQKLATGWPEGDVQALCLTPESMFWLAACIALTLDDPVAAYARIEPTAEATELHEIWADEWTKEVRKRDSARQSERQ